MAGIQYMPDQKTIEEIIGKYNNKKLNLNPGFQRSSVWKNNDRAKLIDSIIKNYPIPSIFLYRREKDGEIVYDVIDGKQRIETFLMYMVIMRGNKFSVLLQLPDSSEAKKYFWKDIVKLKKRHAKYYNSNLLKTASRIADKFTDYFISAHILSRDQINRMKHVELICEIMISIYSGDVINKKIALDKVMDSGNLPPAQLNKLKSRTITVINHIKRVFPKLSQTRFSQLSDFYSLAVLISKFENEKLILNDKRRNRLGWDILVAFSNGVDEVRERQKKARNVRKSLELQREYLLTVIQDSDSITQRRLREKILRNLLQNLFEKKDSKRTFSMEQRRLLWNTSNSKKCKTCKKELTWEDFTIDHIDPYSKGGRSELDNAAIMCRECNSKKGNR